MDKPGGSFGGAAFFAVVDELLCRGLEDVEVWVVYTVSIEGQ